MCTEGVRSVNWAQRETSSRASNNRTVVACAATGVTGTWPPVSGSLLSARAFSCVPTQRVTCPGARSVCPRTFRVPRSAQCAAAAAPAARGALAKPARGFGASCSRPGAEPLLRQPRPAQPRARCTLHLQGALSASPWRARVASVTALALGATVQPTEGDVGRSPAAPRWSWSVLWR